MSIFKYEVINPTTDNKRPFFDKRKGLFYAPLKKKYRYFVEATVLDENGCEDYFIILGNVKFDKNCRLCHTDNYGRCQIKVKGKIKDYILEEVTNRGNVDLEYIESTDTYDVFKVV